jgi:hypothetical protein
MLKRPVDVILDTPSDIRHALDVVGKTRQKYVRDKSDPTFEYYVMDQFHLKKEGISAIDVQVSRLTYDMIAVLGPVLCVAKYQRAAMLMLQDLKLVWSGRLSVFSIRTPIFSWFRTFDVANKENQRVVLTQKKKPLKYPIKPDLSGKRK